MDFSTILGILSGLGMIALAIIRKNSLIAFYDFSSLLIVCGGTFASTLMCFSFRSILWMFKDVVKTFSAHKIDFQGTINELIRYAERIKIDGHLALENAETKDHLTRKGINLIVDDIDAINFREMLVIERETLLNHQQESWMVLEKMSDLAPSWGLIGTLIGLVLMMLELKNPSQLGRGMSIALLTTFYGAVLSNLVFVPLATKIENRSRKDALRYDLIVEGLTSIQKRQSPRLIREKLIGFLHPQD